MKKNEPFILVLIKIAAVFLLSHWTLFLSAAQYALNEEKIWSALSSEVEHLRQKKKDKEALRLLQDFQKQFPRSSHLPSAWLNMAEILLEPLGQIEDGFLYLEKTENSTDDMRIMTRVKEYKKKYGHTVTQKRLNKLQNAVLRYFMEHQSFPGEIQQLFSSSAIQIHDLKDGFGSAIVYELKNNPLFKGENELAYVLFSTGEDQKKGTHDDLFPEKEVHSSGEGPLSVINTYQEGKLWVAEISYPSHNRSSRITRKIKEGELFQDFYVFGIGEQGLVLLKGEKPLVVKK
ncbi:MAG: hypothetical protein JW774_05875 [Candidatus Aureabacteria bacterium]|nr:hypothetical protein [Candidatus Auribacterota bacterium]